MEKINIETLISDIRPKLPLQNPLHSFVHNNILQNFEDDLFHIALDKATELYRAKGYLAHQDYLSKYHEGKISRENFMQAIEHYMISYLIPQGLDKKIIEKILFSTDVLKPEDLGERISRADLWEEITTSFQLSQELILFQKSYLRQRKRWEKEYGFHYPTEVYPFIIRLISSFLDQGQSFWSNPYVQKGFFSFLQDDMKATSFFLSGWMSELSQKVQLSMTKKPEEIILEHLEAKGLSHEQAKSYLLDLLFDLKGWSGMVNKLEVEPWQSLTKAPQIKLVDYIAMLVMVEESIDLHLAKKFSVDLTFSYSEKFTLNQTQQALLIYLYHRELDLQLDQLAAMDIEVREDFLKNIFHFRKFDVIKIWHDAYELSFYQDALSAVISHQSKKQQRKVLTPEAQIFFCIDDREESIRRHIEEVNPKLQTFGVVGFFGIDMCFKGVESSRHVALCPPVIKASRIIEEVPDNKFQEASFQKTLSRFGKADLALYYNSRSLVRGTMSTIFLGLLSSIPLLGAVFLPFKFSNMRKRILSSLFHTPQTHLELTHYDDSHGYSPEEMSKIVATILKMTGVVKDFSPFILLIGHGSTSTNNPFKQSYGCGACGGNAGSPNSRVFAKMANDPVVRELLKKEGICIPEATKFVAGFHDTSTDSIEFYDTQDLSSGDSAKLAEIQHNLSEACQRNALERCQRFSSFDEKSAQKALEHVRERAFDIAQPRPEYGHSLNALAILGPRELTEGLYLARRSFLLSYDWKIDPDGEILKGIIIGGIPVCVNINMDYYFSTVDNDNFGCGSKLPLNLTSLLGVMAGAHSDLRIGLAKQMIEIHEPIRNMTIIHAPKERVKKIFLEHGRLKKFIKNQWMNLVVHDPETGDWLMWSQDDFRLMKTPLKEMPVIQSSKDLVNSDLLNQFCEIHS